MLVCLMPLSQYKIKDLYRHIELFELADPSLFEDAAVTKNLCICSLKKNITDRYTWNSLLFNSFDNRYKEFYRWNIDHNIGLSWKGANYKKPEDFDIETDFIDCSRWVNEMKGSGYHPKSGFGYAYNVIGSGYINKWGSDLAYLRLPSKPAKINFSKYAYNYSSNKRDCLASKVAAGLFVAHANEEVYMLVPQIDWSNIHINQKELWDKGLYDDAVLNEMGLKWNADKTVIVKDE